MTVMKKTAIVLGLMFLLAALSGCGSEGETDRSTADDEPKAVPIGVVYVDKTVNETDESDPSEKTIPQDFHEPDDSPSLEQTENPETTPEPQLIATEETATEGTDPNEVTTDEAAEEDRAIALIGEPIIDRNNMTVRNGDVSNFDLYDNADQQDTNDAYVLNTSTLKIHYPDCKYVRKIAPQNYSTSNSTVQELKAMGYTTCGNCFK